MGRKKLLMTIASYDQPAPKNSARQDSNLQPVSPTRPNLPALPLSYARLKNWWGRSTGLVAIKLPADSSFFSAYGTEKRSCPHQKGTEIKFSKQIIYCQPPTFRKVGGQKSKNLSGSKPAELKHLSKRRKREQLFIPQVAASEKGGT